MDEKQKLMTKILARGEIIQELIQWHLADWKRFKELETEARHPESVSEFEVWE